jgi:hypothetical protein
LEQKENNHHHGSAEALKEAHHRTGQGDDADDIPLKCALSFNYTGHTPRLRMFARISHPMDVNPLMRWATLPRIHQRIQGGESIQAKE